MRNNITNNQFVYYILHDDFDYEATLKNTIGALLCSMQENNIGHITYREILVEYNKKYKILLPLETIQNALRKYFIIYDKKYEFRPEEKRTISDISKDLENEKKRYEEKKGRICRKFKEYYKIYHCQEISKKDADKKIEKILNVDDCDSIYSLEEVSPSLEDKKEFIHYLSETNDKESIEFLENVNIANSIIDFGFCSKLSQYKNCIFFIDTPILLKYLGYDGLEYRKIYRKIFSKLDKIGVSYNNIFPHTLEETFGIIYSISSAYNHMNYSAPGVDMYLKARKEFGEQVEQYIPLNKSLDEFKKFITKSDNPIKFSIEDIELTLENNIYNYADLEKLFEEKYQKTFRSFPSRIRNDINSIVKISALRQKENCNLKNNPKDMKFFMLTDNKAFENIALENSKKKYKENQCDNDAKFGEILFIDRIIYSIWEDSGKLTLPKDIFKQRCLYENIISSEFRTEFNKAVSRLEFFDKVDVSQRILNDPDMISKSYYVYMKNKKSIVAVENFIKEEMKKSEKAYQAKESYKEDDLKISIIIPVVNDEISLRRCFDSVINQNYSDIECVFIECDSSSECSKICKEYEDKDSRIIFVSKENVDFSDARNIGMKKATGDYILFMDSGDYLVDAWSLERLVEKANETRAEIVIGKTIFDNKKKNYKQNVSSLEEYLKSCSSFFVTNKLYKADILEKERFVTNLKNADIAFTAKLLFSRNVAFVNEETYFCSSKIYNELSESDIDKTFDILTSSFDILNKLNFYKKNNAELVKIVKTVVFTFMIFPFAVSINKKTRDEEKKKLFFRFFEMIRSQNSENDFYVYASIGIKKNYKGVINKIKNLLFLIHLYFLGRMNLKAKDVENRKY